LILEKAILPRSVTPSGRLELQLQWLNDGVAPLYEPCSVALAFLDAKDKIVHRQWLAGSNPRSWVPGQSKTETLSVGLTSLPAGSYKAAVGLFLSQDNPLPAYRLGIQGRTADGWYVLYDKLECKP
jgi:hypothetical protein